MSTDPPTTDEIREMGKEEIRKQFASGWMELARYETLVLALDALLEAPAVREFTLEELAEKAGTTPKSLDNRIDSLVELSVIEPVKHDDEMRYTLNGDSPIVDQLYELNVAVQRVRNGDGERVTSSDSADGGLSTVAADTRQNNQTNPGGSRYSVPESSR